jgi:hypothetical protein
MRYTAVHMSTEAWTDPLGRTVRMDDATWYRHILRNHRELTGERGVIGSTIKNPLEIHFSSSDPDCRLYYGPGSRLGLIICVVADVVGGYVKTAYFSKKIKQGGKEWP